MWLPMINDESSMMQHQIVQYLTDIKRPAKHVAAFTGTTAAKLDEVNVSDM